MVNASRLTYPHCRSTGCTAGTSVPRPAMPMLSRHCPHPIHVITGDIHEFRAQVVHLGKPYQIRRQADQRLGIGGISCALSLLRIHAGCSLLRCLALHVAWRRSRFRP